LKTMPVTTYVADVNPVGKESAMMNGVALAIL
jgi:hypothetical protein